MFLEVIVESSIRMLSMSRWSERLRCYSCNWCDTCYEVSYDTFCSNAAI